MKGIYIYDLKFLFDSNTESYFSKSFSNEMWQIYLKEFQEIEIYNSPIISENKSDLPKVNGSGLKVVNYPWWQKKNKIKKFVEFYLHLKKLKDTAIIIRLPSIKGSFIGILCVVLNKKYLVEVVGDAYGAMYHHGTLKGKIIAPFFELITKVLVYKASTVTYITKKFLQKKYPNSEKSYTVPNVRINKTNRKVLDQKLEDIKSMKNRKIIKIGLIGSLEVKYKGHNIAVEAIRQLNSEYENTHQIELHFVGEGNILSLNNKTTNNYVVHHGVLNKYNLTQWLKEIDIYIQPSLTEAQGRSIIEAMSIGCPVIASRVGGIVELLDSKCLVEPGSPKELAEKILWLLSNEKILIEQATRNFEEAREYEIEKVNRKREIALKNYKEIVLKHNF